MMKHWIRFFCLSLLSIVTGIASAQDAEVIEISTVEQLKAFRDAVNSGNTYAGKTVKLTLDLDLSSESNWTPIGNLVSYPGQSFDGIFDGDGHTISNLTINDNTPKYAVAGLFGSVVNGTIKNLTVKNVNITSTYFAGGIVAYTSNAPTIENCHVIGGTIKTTPEKLDDGKYDNGCKAGGIMGYATAGSTIKNCTVEDVTITGYRDIGGIVGYSGGTITNNTVKNVTVTQDLTNAYEGTPNTIGDIIGRSSGATLSNNKVIKSIVKVTDNEGNEAVYGDMKDAFDAINADPKESYTITLLKDATYTDAEQYRHAALAKDNTVTKNVIIDGAGHTLTFVGGGVRGFYTESTAAEKVTFQNMTIADNTRYDAENGNNAWEFAYLEMGEAKTCPLEFTNVKFADGISVDGTKTTFTDCEFISDGNAKRSTPTAENCIWISNGDVIVNNCTFTGYRAIKLHEAYGTEIGSVVIDGCTFKDLSVKPAVAIGSLNAETSVTITNNTIEGVQKGDQEMYLYESDTDLANFTNNLSGNTFNAKNEAELTVALNSGMFNKAVLQGDIALTKNVTCGLEEGTFTLVQGEKTLTSEGHAIALNPGVTIVTDKQTDIFSAVDAGYKVVETAVEGGYTYTVVAKEYVAQIGDVKYESLAEAVAAVKDGETILMLADVPNAGGMSVSSGKNFTVDFAGHTYTLNKPGAGSTGTETNGFQLLKNSTIVFKNGTINISEENLTKAVDPAKNIMRIIQNYANLTLENMTIDGTNQYGGKDYIMSFNNGTSVIKDTKVVGADKIAFDVCTWSSYKATSLDVTGNSEIKGDIEISSTNTPDALSLMLTSGTHDGAIIMAQGADKATVSKVNEFVQAAPEGYKWVDNGNGTSTLKPCEYVAQIGDVKYESLAEAVAAVKDGETILMLADVPNAGGMSVSSGKNFTVDFNGHTYTLNKPGAGSTGTETNGFQLLKNSTIVFKNGTINISEENLTKAVDPAKNIMRIIQNYANLTLENMTIDGTNQYGGKDYIMSFNNGTSVIKDTKVVGADKIAFDVCTWSSYKATSLDVTGNSEIKGDIEISSTNTPDALSLMLTSGTHDGAIIMAQGADKATVSKVNEFVQAAPEGYKWVDNGNGTSTLKPCEYVAQIGDVKYESLAEAVAAVKDGETILMLADVPNAGGMSVSSGKNFTVDFNGHTYTLNKPGAGSTGTETNGFQLLKNSTIVFKNGTINISEENLTKAVDPAKNIMRIIQNYANLTLENMTIDGTNQYGGKDYIMSFNNGTSVVKDTKVVGADKIAFDVCTWSSYKATSLDVTGNSEIKGDIEISSTNTPDALSLMLTSGTHDGAIIMAQGADKATVSKVNEFVQAAPEGYKWVDNGDGTSTLAPAHYVAQIGDVKYESLTEAVAAAGTAETTITLLKDAATDGVICGEGVVVPSGSNIIFDLNGLTYEVNGKTVGSTGTESQGFQLLQGSNITFKNGTLKATSPSAQMVIQNYSNLTLENVNIDGTGLSGWAYALSNNCGTINLTGSTSITAKEGGRAFDTCKFRSYAIPTVNINTTGTITGPIEVTGGKLNIENGKFDVTWVTDSHYAAGDIQIKGGVFTAEVSADYCAEGFVCVDNGDATYKYTVKSKEEAGIYELKDNTPYPENLRTNGGHATEVTYTRSFTNAVYSCWWVPFDYTVTEEDASKFDFYKIHMIAGSNNPGEMEESGKIWIFITKQASGKLLKAGHVYVIKPKAAVNDYIFKSQDVDLLPENSEKSLKHTETSDYAYDFYGTYVGVTTTKAFEFMALTNKGQIAWNDKAGRTLQQYRWFVRVNSKTGDADADAKISIGFMEGDEETDGINNSQVIYREIEGIYTLGGMKVEHPVKGVNIIKYTDGRTKKIYVK